MKSRWRFHITQVNATHDAVRQNNKRREKEMDSRRMVHLLGTYSIDVAQVSSLLRKEW